jgi:hypothetical protein
MITHIEFSLVFGGSLPDIDLTITNIKAALRAGMTYNDATNKIIVEQDEIASLERMFIIVMGIVQESRIGTCTITATRSAAYCYFS